MPLKKANRTLILSEKEIPSLAKKLIHLKETLLLSVIESTVKPTIETIIEGNLILQDALEALSLIKKNPPFVDLLILDPPYNLTKNYAGQIFQSKIDEEYSQYFEQILKMCIPILKPESTVYVCSDWKTSNLIFPILSRYFYVRNRITWEREKGRASKKNWKNNMEDIWFCTVSNHYYFDPQSVKVKREVLAPYKQNQEPKDWSEENGMKYRFTAASNLWTDITVPFWSMPENTRHPAQKSEKLIAKLILASCPVDGFVFDPFFGSGTSLVVAKKLKRRFSGIEIQPEYCYLAQKRIDLVDQNSSIQGYENRVFWYRNIPKNKRKSSAKTIHEEETLL